MSVKLQTVCLILPVFVASKISVCVCVCVCVCVRVRFGVKEVCGSVNGMLFDVLNFYPLLNTFVDCTYYKINIY